MKKHVVSEALNIIDESNMPQITALQKNCIESVYADFSNAYDVCSKIVDYLTDVSGGVYVYDQRIFAVDFSPAKQLVTDYFSVQDEATMQTIQESIHVYPHAKFAMNSDEVSTALDNDKMLDYRDDIAKLIAAGSPVLIYAGEFDQWDGPKTIEPWLRELKFDESDTFWG